MSHASPRRRCLIVVPALLVLYGCGATVYLDKFDTAPAGQPPAPPAVGTSTATGSAVVAVHPQNPGSADRWLRLARPVATQPGGEYIGTLTETLSKTKGSVTLVGFIPKASPIMMTVFFEAKAPAPPVPLLHIDLLPNRNIRLNDSTIAGTFEFDTLIAMIVNFDLGAPSPKASVFIRGGGNDVSTDVPVSASAASFGLGRVRVVAPFEGVNAPAGAFLVNDLLATRPNK